MARQIRTQVVQLQDVSYEKDSGWRDVEESHVAVLKAVVTRGEWGSTTLAGPSLIAEGGTLIPSKEDAKYVIFNGMHMVLALIRLRTELEGKTIEACEALPWWDDAIARIFQHGLTFIVYEFQEGVYTHLRHRAVQALAHEEDSNKMLHTTMLQKSKLARSYYESEGNDWTKAEKSILEALGVHRRRTVSRWFILARDCSDVILSHMTAVGLKELPQKYVTENKYLVGRMADARFRLMDEWAKVAFDWLSEVMTVSDGGKPSIPADKFIHDYCCPAKHAESWLTAQKKVFGVVATSFRAFHRTAERLRQPTARQAIVTWLYDPQLRSRRNFGMEELDLLVREMETVKAGTNKSTNMVASGSALAVAPVDMTDEAAAGGAPPGEEDDDMGCLLDDGPGAVQADPIIERAEQLAVAEMANISIHTEKGAFIEELKTAVYQSAKPLVVVECPTSRAAVFTTFFDLICEVPVRFSLLVPLGSRDELISTIKAILRKKLPGRTIYTVALSLGKQSSRQRPSYALFVPSQDGPVTFHVGLEGCRANASEGVRLRCTSSACSMRAADSPADPSDPDQQAQTDKADEEIPLEDRELPDFEHCFDQVAEAGSGDEAADDDKGQDDRATNLFAYAAPLAVHKKVLSQICAVHARTHLIVLTRSAHPGLLVAGRSFGLKVVAFVDGVTKHSLGHGSLLLKRLMIISKMAAARDALPGITQGSKRIHAGDFQFQVIVGPPVQPVLLRDITPSVTNWRTGLNNNPAGLDVKTLSQVQAESDYTGCNIKLVRVAQRDNMESVVARRSMRDGDVVCNLGGLAFDSVDNLRAFLNSNPSGRELIGGLVRIDGVQHEALGDDGSSSQASGDFNPTAPKFAAIYFVFTGVGRYVRHYAQVGAKQPNAVLSCNLGAGAGDGLVQLVVKTRNRSGIAQGTPVLLNFGMDYDHAVVSKVFAEEASQPKRIRSMLDAYFKQLGERDAQEAAAASGEAAVLAIDAAAVAAPVPALDAPTAVPAAGGVVPETPTPTPKQTPMLALPAPTPTTALTTAPPAAPTAISPVEIKLVPGEAVVGEISQPLAAKLVYKGGSSPGGAGSIRLAAAGQLTGNKKVPPNTVLAVAKEGAIAPAADATAAGAALRWKFTKTKDVLVSGLGGPVKTLYDFIKETGATSISKHKAWKAGSVPTTVDFAGSAAESAPKFVPNSAVHRVAGGQCIGRPGRAAWLGMGMALRRGVPMAHL